MNTPARWAAFGAGPAARRSVAWFGGVVIAGIVALALFDIVRSYHDSVAATGVELDAQARVIAEQTARSVQAVDVVLRHLADEHRSGRLERRSPEDLHALLREQAVGLVQANGLTLHDAKGKARALSWLYPTPERGANVSDSPAFLAVRDDPRGDLYVGNTVRSSFDGLLVFPIVRRLYTPAGEFDGLVAARGRIEYFQQFYRDVQPDPSTAVSLVHRNGTLLARHPRADAALGRSFPLVDRLIAEGATGTTPLRQISPLDGVERFGALRLVPDYPMVVIVTRDTAAALAPWRAQALGSALRTLALAVLAALLLAALARQLGRLSAARESLEESQERYALAAAGSDDGIWDWDLRAGTAYESARARELQGLPPGPETQPLAVLQGQLTYHPDDAALRRDTMQAHLDGHTPAYEVEYRVRHPDGVYRWIRVRALCIRDANGKPLRIAGSVGDIDARKRTEVALRESEQRFAVAVAGSDDGIWEYNYRSGHAFASRRAREILGMPEGPELQSIEAWFALMAEHVHPEDLPRRLALLDAHLAGRSPAYECEFRVRAGAGEHRWVRVRGMCVRDTQGAPLLIAGSASDIDARKRAEEALRISEERFALAVAGSNDGILDWDLVTDRMFTSPRAMHIAGVPADTVVRTRAQWTALLQIHPDDRQRHADDFRRHLEGGTEVREGEYRVRQPDGRYRWVRVRGMSVRDALGRSIRWAGSVSDIDAQKRTEEALRRSEERYQLAVEGSNQGLWDWDLASDLLFLSPRAQRLNFVEPGEPLRPRREWITRTDYHPDDVARVRHAIAGHLRGRTAEFSVDYRVRHHTGDWHWYRQRGLALRDAAGRPYRMAGSIEDISAPKNAEAERERLEQQLRQAQKLEAIGTLAGGIAHDFNNILSAILGYGELAQKDAAEGTRQRRHIDAALSAGLRAKSLVERILAFSRAGMGERVPVHVQSVVAEALDGVAAALPAGVRLTRRLDAGDAGLLGDPTQIHQVVMNLCANAVQAMKSDGTLAVALDVVELDEPRPVATSTLAPGRYLRLAVRDSGSGIPPQLLERIFDPFFTTKEVGVGTGLGLSLVHGIVTDLGGGIAVESRPGAGSTFTVHLPWQRYVAAPVAQEEAVAPGAGETILLVDDEEPLVRLGEELLAELGYEPVGFVSSTAALASFRADPDRFQAVLSDEAMPELTGSELVTEIRRLRPAIPIVLMSGFVSPALAARARAGGVAEVLGKPLVSRDIARALAAALHPATL